MPVVMLVVIPVMIPVASRSASRRASSGWADRNGGADRLETLVGGNQVDTSARRIPCWSRAGSHSVLDIYLRWCSGCIQIPGVRESMKNRLSYLTAVLLTSSCLVYAAIHTDYDHKADFGRYHTYSWIGVNAGDSLWHNRITSAVDMAL